MALRVDRRPQYLNTQGLCVGKTGNVLRAKEKDKVVHEVRTGEVCRVNLMGNSQLSTQAVQALCDMGTPVCYFSFGGWFYRVTTGLNKTVAQHPNPCKPVRRAGWEATPR